MPLSSNVHSYDDIRAVLDSAQAAGGARYELETPGQAIYWRARAYYFRKLLYNLAKERLEGAPGMAPSTPYDRMKLTVEGCFVTIEFVKPQGKLTTLDGDPLSFASVEEVDEDELLAEAERLAKELGE